MKILAVRGSNLASLAGDFEVDFTRGAIGRAGLFAITGPVGAGKSTLLDAICLALFARTPRLADRGGVVVGNDDGLGSQDARSLMTRGRATARAEVDFVGCDGLRYRATWSAHRARQRAKGRPQAAEMRLTALADGAVLGDTKTATLQAIEQRLGLTFEQFCRSALLAQGEFARFLNATAGERGELLERMTRSELYTELSKAAHERARDHRSTIEATRAALASVAVLDDSARAELERAALAQRSELAALEVEREALAVAARWHARDRELADLVAAAEREHADARRAIEAAADPLAELELVERVWPARGAWLARRRAAAAVTRLLQEREAAQQRLEHARAGVHRASAALGERAAGCARLARQAEQRLVECSAERERIDTGVDAAARELDVATRAEAAARASCAELALDGGLLRDELDARRQVLAAIGTAVGALAEARGRAEREVGELARARAAADSARATAAAASPRVHEWEVRHDEALRALSAARAVVDLAVHRHALIEGEPCPLCGATGHPWAHDAAPSDVLAGPEQRVAEVERELATARAAAVRAVEAARARDGDVERAERAAQTAQQQLAASIGRLASLRAEVVHLAPPDPLDDADGADWLREQGARVADALAELRAADALRAERARALEAAREHVERARAEWLDRRDRRDAAARERAAIEDAARALRELLAELSAECERRGIRVPAAGRPAALGESGRARRADGAGARAATPVGDWQEVARGERRTANRAREALADAIQACAEAAARSREADAALAEQHGAEDAARGELDAALGGGGIGDDELAELLDREPEWLDRQRAWRAALQRAVADASARRDDRVRARTEHAEARGDARGADELGVAQAALRERHDAARERERGIELRLREDELARKRAGDARRQLEQAEIVARPWLELSELIGSADGKRFRTFAQGLTFRVLVEHGNRRLAELAPRYALAAVPDAELELQVVDRDMAGDVRSVQTLSGGETFLFALALALGLADLAATRTRIESLFIDEGFGNLDPASLETALAALDALQASGYQVGVISHVPGLAERIGAQVVIEPLGGGHSRLRVEPREFEPPQPRWVLAAEPPQEATAGGRRGARRAAGGTGRARQAGAGRSDRDRSGAARSTEDDE